MGYDINWSALGAPIDVASAVRRGFEHGSALRERQEERSRRDTFQRSAFAAYDPQTGQVNAPAMRSAFAGAGDIEGALRFDAQQAQRAASARQAESSRLGQLARLADQATPQNWTQIREAATQLGINAEQIPEAYDEQWLSRQRLMLRAMSDPEEMTTFQRDAAAAGYEPGSDGYRRYFENRYAPQPLIASNGDGTFTVIPRGNPASTPSSTGAQPGMVVNGMRFRGGDYRDRNNWEPAQGGQSSGSGSFPVVPQ